MASTSPENLVSRQQIEVLAATEASPVSIPSSASRQHFTDEPCLSEVDAYRDALNALVPRLMGILGWSNINDSGTPRLSDGDIHACGSLRRQAAATAIAHLAQIDPMRKDVPFLLERVRTSILRWQLGLHRRGHPVRQRATDGAFQLATASYVVQTVAETSQSQCSLTINDLQNHLGWLCGRRCDSSWAAAAIVSALVSGAVLLRDKALHRTARKRLGLLLRRQDEEGWFPENRAVDLGYLSLTIDALARIYQANEWEEILEPACRAIRFMTHFVHPDGSFSGCYSGMGTAFLSPYGVELLAPLLPEAAALAIACRRRFASAVPQRIALWNDDLCAILGASLGMTATHAECKPLPAPSLPCENAGTVHFPHAGLSVISTDSYHAVVNGRKAGAIHLTWKGNMRTMSDSGINVLFQRTLRTSGRWDLKTKFEVSDQMISVRGILRKATNRPPRRLRRVVRRFCRRLAERWAMLFQVAPLSPTKMKSSGRPLAHDFFSRVIHFGNASIRINDSVECRLPCESILFHGPTSRDRDGMLDVDLDIRTRHTPRMVAGGRQVTVSRIYREGGLESSGVSGE